MRTEYIEQKNSFKIYPESDKEIVALARLAGKANPKKSQLHWIDDNLTYFYIPVNELINVATN